VIIEYENRLPKLWSVLSVRICAHLIEGDAKMQVQDLHKRIEEIFSKFLQQMNNGSPIDNGSSLRIRGHPLKGFCQEETPLHNKNI
jgi:hypothetical protein